MLWTLIVGVFLCQAAIYFVLKRRFGCATALGGSVLAGFAVPGYWDLQLFDLVLPGRSLSIAGILLLFLVTGGSLRFRFKLVDLAVGIVLAIAIASDVFVHGRPWHHAFMLYAEWMMPYGAGRYAMGNQAAFDKIRPLIYFVAVSWIVVWAIEIYSEMNLWQTLTGIIDPSWEVQRRKGRFGIVRSYGQTMHPIFFAAQWLAILPIAALSTQRNVIEDRRGWLVVACFIFAVSAILLSRAAVVVSMATAMLIVAWMKPKVWFAYVALLLGVVIFAVTSPDRLTSLWMQTGGRTDQRQTIVEVNDELVTHSSTRARYRMLEVYGKSAQRAGFLGYGSEATSGFPPNIPHLPKEAQATEEFWTVDNTYLLMVLRFGYLGLAGFVFLVISPVLMICLQPNLDLRRDAWIMYAAPGMIAVLLLTVYCDYEILLPLMWTLGLTTSLCDARIGDEPLV